jgi:ketosteroid isomerase-like protein
MKPFATLVLGVALVTGTLLTAQEGRPVDPALEAMAAAERAFARTALEKGVRDAFVEFFAENSFGYYPTPMNAREFYRGLPPTPPTRRLEWEPRLGDIARSGELGWLTGPFTSQDTSTSNPPRHGCYFSIWSRQQDGGWKVLMDVGVPTPGPVAFARDGFAAVDEPGQRYLARAGEPRDGGPSVVPGDTALSGALEKHDAVSAYRDRLTSVSRLHVPGRQPLVGREAILAWLGESSRGLRTVPDAGQIARSAEIGFTRGSYEVATDGPAGQAVEKGYYVRMWKRVATGDWTIAVEVRSPAPPAR